MKQFGRILVLAALVLAFLYVSSGARGLGSIQSTTGGNCAVTRGVNGTGQIIVAKSQNPPLTGSDGSKIYIYNPNVAYGPVPSCVEDWIPSDCTDQGTVFDPTGESEIQGALPWVPYFQASMEQPQFNGFGVLTLHCGKTWRFLAWDDDSTHSYHELSAPGRTDCPNGLVRYTQAPILLHDPYGSALVAELEERGSGNDWVASQVSMVMSIEGSDLYPPNCPQEN